MPKDKSSSSFSNKSHDLFYNPYPTRDRSSSRQEDAALEEVTCPICMESPHNAVLLLCSSSDKGCRPFMCDTSYRHSNCLDQYIKAHAKNQQTSNSNSATNNLTINNVSSNSNSNDLTSSVAARGGSADISDHIDFKTCKGLELVCPLCRGKVVGWKVVDKVRQYHNYKRRGCAQDSCTYVGAYEQLRKHARYIHPFARPSEVDPARQRDWWRLESQRDLGDVFSSIQSAMPGATIVGDYVIEEGDEEDDRDEEVEPENDFEMEDEEEDEYHDEIAMANNTSSSNSSRSSVPPVDNRLWTMLFLFRVLGGTPAPSDASAVSAAAASSHHSHSQSRHHHSPQQRNHQQQSSQQHRHYSAPPPRNNRGAPRALAMSPGSFHHQGSSSSSSSRAAMIERSRTSSSSSSATSFRRSRRSLR